MRTSVLLLFFSIFVNTINGSQFTITEATIDDIHRAFNENRLTSRQLVDLYLDQIAALNPQLRSVLEVNPDARNQAEEADREREEAAAKDQNCGSLGELHGIPILLKDSIGTKDKLNTTCGSYALLGSTVARDAGVVQRLRRAGAVILGKASLNEWYGLRSLAIPGGWCARGGQAVNPYLKFGGTCGSSSGSAISVAANMVSVSLGTETDGSIICPADRNSVVGLYQATPNPKTGKKVAFAFEHCWVVLKNQPKWSMPKERSKGLPQTLSLVDQVDSNDDDTVVLERPIGRKAEKAKQKRIDGDKGFDDYLAKKLHYIEASHEQDKETLCIKAERLCLETIREEGRIMTMDTSGMNDKEKLYFENLKDQILARQVGFDPRNM